MKEYCTALVEFYRNREIQVDNISTFGEAMTKLQQVTKRLSKLAATQSDSVTSKGYKYINVAKSIDYHIAKLTSVTNALAVINRETPTQPPPEVNSSNENDSRISKLEEDVRKAFSAMSETIKKNNEEMKNMVQSLGNQLKGKKTKSAKVTVEPSTASGHESLATRSTKKSYAAVVRPSDGQSIEELGRALLTDPIMENTNDGTRIVRTHNGYKIISKSVETRDKLVSTAKSAKLDVTATNDSKAMIELRNIDKAIDSSQLCEQIIKQNSERNFVTEDLKLVFTKSPRAQATNDPVLKRMHEQFCSSRYNAILSISDSCKKKLIDCDFKLRVGFNIIRAFKYFDFRQCFRCWGFGHTSTRCIRKVEESICGHCSGDHRFKDCEHRNDAPKCINCAKNITPRNQSRVTVDHRPLDRNCPRYKSALKNFVNAQAW